MKVLTLIFIISLIMFPLSGIDKIMNFESARDRLMRNLPVSVNLANLMIVGAIILQLVAPAMVMYSLLYGDVWVGLSGVFALAAFTILATLVFYIPPKGAKYYGLLGNTTTLGCMLLIGHTLSGV